MENRVDLVHSVAVCVCCMNERCNRIHQALSVSLLPLLLLLQ